MRVALKFRWLVVIAVAFMALSGCGFQLQGSQVLPASLNALYISTDDQYSEFYRALSEQLRVAGIQLVEHEDQANTVFLIEEDVTGQRVLSVSARNVPREFEVFYTVSYRVSQGSTVVLDSRTQTRTQDYTWDETQVLGKEREERMLRESLVDDLVRIVLMQLSGI